MKPSKPTLSPKTGPKKVKKSFTIEPELFHKAMTVAFQDLHATNEAEAIRLLIREIVRQRYTQ